MTALLLVLLTVAVLVASAALAAWFSACLALDRACVSASEPRLLQQAHHVWYGAAFSYLATLIAIVCAACAVPIAPWAFAVLALLLALVAVDDALQHLLQLHDMDMRLRLGMPELEARAAAINGVLSPVHAVGHRLGWY